MAKTKLTDRLRAEIVARFAAWDSPTQVQAWLKEEHGIEIGPSGLTPYHFDNPLSRENGTPKWVELHDRIRAKVVAGVDDIAISHKRKRLEILQNFLDDMLAGKRAKANPTMVRELLEHAAKEMGEAFTNRHKLEHGGVDGGPLEVAVTRRIVRPDAGH